MKKILNIISSVKGDDSFSIKLSNAVLDKITSIYPDSSIHTRDLSKSPFPHLEETVFTSFYTPLEKQTNEHKEAVLHSDEAIKALMEADILIIGVPLYNFGIPSTLKAWIDHVARSGVTFRYSDGRPEGLVKNKKVYLAIASGGVYSEGPMKSYDFTEPYLRAVLGFIGLTDITTFRVEGTVIPAMKDTALPKALSQVEEYAF
jgi:FMN-dependent NADH-azoreductase